MSEVKKSALPFKPYSLDESLSKLKLLIYGPNVSGKTVLAGSAAKVAELSPVLLLDMGGNTTPLTSFDFKDKITPVKVESFSKGDQSFSSVLDFVAADGQFKTLVIDSLTGLQTILVDEVKEKNKKTVADLQVWLAVAGEFKNIIRRIIDLKINVIATATERFYKCPNTGKEVIVPNLSGKVAKEIIGYFDIVGKTMLVKSQQDGEFKRVLHFDGGESFVTRDGTLALKSEKGPFLVGPEMDDLHNLIKTKHKL